jgi:hypothetical protein
MMQEYSTNSLKKLRKAIKAVKFSPRKVQDLKVINKLINVARDNQLKALNNAEMLYRKLYDKSTNKYL